MKTLYLIGIGPGGPNLVTAQAIEAIRAVDVFFLLDKAGRGKEALIAARQAIMARYLEPGGYRVVHAPSPPRRRAPDGYLEVVRDWHARKLKLFRDLLDRELGDGESGALLIWGDPSLYDQSISLFTELFAATPDQSRLVMIPGITAVQALTAGHGIPLNRVGEAVLITTGRQLVRMDPATVENVVVMLDGQGGFQRFRDQNMDIYWGAYLGTDDEVLLGGTLDILCDRILATLARLRETNGWVMDTYLLRRRGEQTR